MVDVDPHVSSPHRTTVPSRSRRAVVVVIGVLVALHSFLVMLWVMPTNPIRDAVGQERLTAWIDPYFTQSWSIFAPTPRRGGENIVVRAHFGAPNSDGARVTEWYDITADEDRRIRHLANPSRIHSATRRLGGRLNGELLNYNDAELRVIAGSFETTSRREIGRRLENIDTEGSSNTDDYTGYLRSEEMLTRFGTMYATSRWGSGVTAVEFKIGHRSVPNYSRRNTADFLDVPISYVRIGARRAIAGNAEAQAAFDSYVRPAPVAGRSSGEGEGG